MTALQTHDALPALEVIQASGLRSDEVSVLRDCINGVRSGETEYYVLVTNRKQTNSKKRIPGEDYAANPALVPCAHRGWLVAAPLNKAGDIYLHIYDEARAQEHGEGFGHTRVTLRGLRSFELVKDPRTGGPITRPGPLADPEPDVAAAPVAAAQAAQPDPRMTMAQAMFTQAQAAMQMGQAATQMGQALLSQIQQQDNPL